MSKGYKLIFILLLTFIIGGLVYFIFFNKKINSDKIPDDYMIVFYGRVGETQNFTYIYKLDNNEPKYGFKYINATSKTVKGSTKKEIKITSEGTIDWIEDITKIVKENDAFLYVEEKKGGIVYSAEEYVSMMIINLGL